VSGIRVASGHLLFFYAYDVGFEIALEEARRKVGAEKHEGTVRDQLATLTDIYTVLNNQAQAARAETLELIIILLIAIEIVMGLLRW
jgi:hypothetical protein